MPKVYLSPSTQQSNIGYGNYGSEEFRMNEVADAVERYLCSKKDQITIYRNSPNMTLAQIVADSNSKKPDIHVAIHSNASEDTKHTARGAMGFAYKKGTKADVLANDVYSEVAKITPTNDHGVNYSTGLYEVNKTAAPATLIEIGFHDNPEDAKFIMDNIDKYGAAIARGILKNLNIRFRSNDINDFKSKDFYDNKNHNNSKNMNFYDNKNPNNYKNMNFYDNKNPNNYKNMDPYDNKNPNNYENMDPYDNKNPNNYKNMDPYDNKNPKNYENMDSYDNNFNDFKNPKYDQYKNIKYIQSPSKGPKCIRLMILYENEANLKSALILSNRYGAPMINSRYARRYLDKVNNFIIVGRDTIGIKDAFRIDEGNSLRNLEKVLSFINEKGYDFD